MSNHVLPARTPVAAPQAVAAIRLFADETAKPGLTMTAYRNWAKGPDLPDVLKLFGSWRNALTVAGLASRVDFTTEEIFASLRHVAANHNGSVTINNYRRSGLEPTNALIIKRFGGWNEALRQAGILSADVAPHLPKAAATKEEVIRALQDYAAVLGDANSITMKGYEQWGQGPSPGQLVILFGSWWKALAAAGVRPKKGYTDQELLDAMRKAADANGGHLTIARYKEMRLTPHVSSIMNRFGTWNQAMKKAGITAPPQSEHRSQHTKESVIETLQAYAQEAGTTNISFPSYTDWGQGPSKSVYVRLFGSWEAALEAAGLTPMPARKVYTDEEILQALREFAEQRGTISSTAYLRSEARPRITTVISRFGSLESAVRQAGLGHLWNPSPRKSPFTREDCLRALRRVDALNQGKVTNKSYTRLKTAGEPGPGTIARHFGSWRNALRAAGIQTRKEDPNELAPWRPKRDN